MRVFLTGITGYIGGVVAEHLQAAGHKVVGLVRSRSTAETLKALGYQAQIGTLSDLQLLTEAARDADAVIQLAQMRFDFSGNFMAQMKLSSELQVNSVRAMLEGLGRSGKPLILTGGTGAYRDTGSRVVDEDTPIRVPAMLAGLKAIEEEVLQASGVRGLAVRPGIVYGRGSGPVMQVLEQSRVRGKVVMTGSGENPLSVVDVDDVARLYLRMLEAAPAGTLLNAVSEPFLTQRQILSVVSQALGFGGKLERVQPWMQQVLMLLGRSSYNIFGSTMRVSSARAQALGWKPRPSTDLFEKIRRSVNAPIKDARIRAPV